MRISLMGRIVPLALALLLTAGFVLAADINKLPPDNWQPASTGRMHLMTDATSPRPFIGLPPCRIVDTRGNGAPITGGAFATDEVRTWVITGFCGLPVGADAVSLNITVTGTGAHPFGYVKVWPGGGAEPGVSTLNWDAAGQTIANAAIVPLSTAGSISLRSGNAGAHVIVDINGYFSSVLGTPGNYFSLSNNSGLFTMRLDNASASCSGPCGLYATTSSGTAVQGFSASGDGGYFQGTVNGLKGVSTAVGGQRGGVVGILGSVVDNYWSTAGVRGIGTNFGVLGISSSLGAGGFIQNTSTGVVVSGSYLGYSSVIGLHTIGNTSASGTKGFVEPHPTDASKTIRYIALEGPEAGTYFRGRGRFARGHAVIAVPEDFRLVTDEEGLTVQITPIGGMASVAVLQAGLEQIVVQSSRDVEFYYTVQGVRQTFRDYQPIEDSKIYFMPDSPNAKMPEAYSQAQKQRLINNGTFNEDGTVNMKTAERIGWTKVWSDREEAARAASSKEPAARK